MSEDKYVEGSVTEFWKKQGVRPIPVTPCKEGEQGFSWSEFINGLARKGWSNRITEAQNSTE
jgi:hypothetical protein